MEALSEKTVLLVTHQVDFLPAFDSVLVSILLHELSSTFFIYFLCNLCDKSNHLKLMNWLGASSLLVTISFCPNRTLSRFLLDH